MPRLVLNDWHVGTLMSMAACAPGPGSPLSALRTYPRPIAPGEPDWAYLVDKRIVVADGEGWRVNSVVAGVIRACAEPDDVVHIGVGDPEHPGFSIVRRGELNVECTIATAGTTKLSFPLTRSAVLLSLISALSGDDSDVPSPSGFRFRGRAVDAFVLGAALRELRSDTAPITVASLKRAVARYAVEPKLTAGFRIIGEGDAIGGLATSSRRVDASIKRLIAAGHLKLVRDKVTVSKPAEAALTKWPTGLFAINHVEIHEKVPVSRSMQAMRVGGRTLVFRPVLHPGHDPEFEWSEVTRRELRTLVAAMLLRDEELEAFVSGKRTPTRARPGTGAATRAERKPASERSPHKRVLVAPPESQAWSPTHVVPEGGLPTWAEADPTSQPTARLDGGLEVQVDERDGAWAHVICSNGWSAWADGRALEEVSEP